LAVEEVFDVNIRHLLVMVVGLGVGTAHAAATHVDSEKASSEAPEAAEATEPEDLSRFEIDTSFEAHSLPGASGYAAVTFSPFGILDHSGFRLRLEGVNGYYHYNQQMGLGVDQTLSTSGRGQFVGGSFLIGYERSDELLNLVGFIGGDYSRNSLGSCNPVSTRGGVKFAGEANYRPNEAWSLILGGSYSTANNSFWSRFRPGFAVLPEIFVGPEFTFQGYNQASNLYDQWRLGAHLRGIKFGPLEFSAATGFFRDKSLGDGFYGSLDASVRF